ncbi:c-type cytochrome biogenesis protein CcsB [Leucobacter sp. wl10]|uniref:c-type cytochrome biogenesis protein CcsB n=1 Tax=Leucobacter sp. wl10 TaxID=2304677 RepID=UPI000E5AC6D4|nr:c-type cytochrome biogenesis protein CcsB [Leucobacter sp. wl10]RGE21466.1 c-type cytochrome biogenesis protein CcsB [Leucobacter sp. wl10]
MNLELQTTLDEFSVLSVWSAITVYVLAFLAFAYDLSQRASLAPAKQRALATAKQREPALVGAGGATVPPPVEDAHEPTLGVPPAQRSRRLWARLGIAFTGLGFILHLAGTITRGIAAERVPWANMYEFALTGTLLIVAVYLASLRWYDLRFLGVFIVGMVVLFLGGSTISFFVVVTPLMDPLKSVWLIVHVFVASLATALFAIAAGLSTMQLMQARRERRKAEGIGEDGLGRGYLRTLPSAESLEALAYRFAILGFIFWTFTLIAGAIWANESWGRYWGFDTKEVWTFVIWVLYAGYIHARATRGWRGARSGWLSLIGFAAVLFNFTIVNLFFKGLHAYSGLT